MINTHRGEVSFTINGIGYAMRPTFGTLANIESKINKTIISLLSNFSQEGISLEELFIIISLGTKSVNVTVSDEDIKQSIISNGITYSTKIVIEFLKSGIGAYE